MIMLSLPLPGNTWCDVRYYKVNASGLKVRGRYSAQIQTPRKQR